MSFLVSLLAGIIISFPGEGRKFQGINNLYVIGAVEPGITNVLVQGVNTPVYRTGSFATVMKVNVGTNVLKVVYKDAAGVEHLESRTFFVSPKPPPAPTSKARVNATNPWSNPKPHPHNKSPFDTIIVVDAGHGGDDPGALSPAGVKESEVNLLTAFSVRDALEDLGYKVILTRDGDYFIRLSDRLEFAKKVNADAFVSIHHNAPGYESNPANIRYAAVYAWNEIGEDLAKKINRRYIEAQSVENTKNGGVKKASFVVIRNPEIPSCLIEIDFLTSPAGEEAILTPERRRMMSLALADGIADWHENN